MCSYDRKNEEPTEEPTLTETEDTILVFTARSPKRILAEGGSQAWVLNPVRAKQCAWLVCTQNRHNPDHEFSDATEPHGTGFLIGRISAVRKSPEDDADDRWMIEIDSYAFIDMPGLWDQGRNPVRYTSLERLGIDRDMIELQPMPVSSMPTPAAKPAGAAPSEVMAEAKRTIAAAFGVKPEAIEITIRG
jgi:hypothetical protein